MDNPNDHSELQTIWEGLLGVKRALSYSIKRTFWWMVGWMLCWMVQWIIQTCIESGPSVSSIPTEYGGDQLRHRFYYTFNLWYASRTECWCPYYLTPIITMGHEWPLDFADRRCFIYNSCWHFKRNLWCVIDITVIDRLFYLRILYSLIRCHSTIHIF